MPPNAGHKLIVEDKAGPLSTSIERAGLLIAVGLLALAAAVVFSAKEIAGPKVLDEFKVGKYDVKVTR